MTPRRGSNDVMARSAGRHLFSRFGFATEPKTRSIGERIPEVAVADGGILRVRQRRQDRQVLDQPGRVDRAVGVARPGVVAEPVRVARPREIRPGGDELISEIRLFFVQSMYDAWRRRPAVPEREQI